MLDYCNRILLLGVLLVAIGGCGSAPTKSSENNLIAATQAIQAGDKETAVAKLTAAIDESPNTWAYFQRARIYVEQGKVTEASADCQKGLELDSTDRDLKWLSTELKKPAAQRFQGRFAKPPSMHR